MWGVPEIFKISLPASPPWSWPPLFPVSGLKLNVFEGIPPLPPSSWSSVPPDRIFCSMAPRWCFSRSFSSSPPLQPLSDPLPFSVTGKLPQCWQIIIIAPLSNPEFPVAELFSLAKATLCSLTTRSSLPPFFRLCYVQVEDFFLFSFNPIFFVSPLECFLISTIPKISSSPPNIRSPLPSLAAFFLPHPSSSLPDFRSRYTLSLFERKGL